MGENDNNIGKKIFFLYPQDLIPGEMLQQIIKNEYEAFIINDHHKLLNLLKKYQNSIAFINIDAELRNEEWFNYIRSINELSGNNIVQIGLLSHEKNKTLEETYLKQFKIPLGFTILNASVDKNKDTLLKVLKASNAKGRRKYIRIECKNKTMASFNAGINNKIYNGFINFISSVGMACQFEKKNEEIMLIREFRLSDIQLRLKGSICKVSGKVFGIRESEEGKIYVILFDNSISEDSKEKINNFIFNGLKDWINEELKMV